MNIQGKAEWVRWLAGIAISGAVAGVSAGLGFYTTINARMQQIEARTDRIEQAQQLEDARLRAVEAGQRADDILHAADTVEKGQLQKQIDKFDRDMEYLQRNLIGRVRLGRND